MSGAVQSLRAGGQGLGGRAVFGGGQGAQVAGARGQDRGIVCRVDHGNTSPIMAGSLRAARGAVDSDLPGGSERELSVGRTAGGLVYYRHAGVRYYYQGNCRACGVAMYGRKAIRLKSCGADCLAKVSS